MSPRPQELEYLGFVINTREMSISLSEMKVKEIWEEATGMMSMRIVLLKKLAHFIGMLVAAKPAVPTALLHFHGLRSPPFTRQNPTRQMFSYLQKWKKI